MTSSFNKEYDKLVAQVNNLSDTEEFDKSKHYCERLLQLNPKVKHSVT